ncbi:hypothetical protein I79_017881 [Cricetulus griseus]|uniref:Uncharacterized protein n=1 Tax=Cricetulus griseus TaxID=10029 RepID=G3I380_CRIGR|nr:hypothetical protein I79_017881 [Cricetulus griseus]
MVAHNYNLGTWKVNAKESEVQSHQGTASSMPTCIKTASRKVDGDHMWWHKALIPGLRRQKQQDLLL